MYAVEFPCIFMKKALTNETGIIIIGNVQSKRLNKSSKIGFIHAFAISSETLDAPISLIL